MKIEDGRSKMMVILVLPSSICIGRDSVLFTTGYYSPALGGCPTGERREVRGERP
jgi:hypothetical protein